MGEFVINLSILIASFHTLQDTSKTLVNVKIFVMAK